MNNRRTSLLLVVVSFLILVGLQLSAEPPFSGTIFLDPDIITSSDPTAFQSIEFVGRDTRQMFDRRQGSWISVANAFIFDVVYDDGIRAQAQVNPEFGSESAAMGIARKYATVIGRLPTVLRLDMSTISIHKGNNDFGGGSRDLLIHVERGDDYEADGILEETLVHEASHMSLDGRHAETSEWKAAQQADGEFISFYARDYSSREDIAETFLLYYAYRYKRNRISDELATTIFATVPNRIAYFDEFIELYPEVAGSDGAGLLFDEAHGGPWTLASSAFGGTAIQLGATAGEGELTSEALAETEIVTFAAPDIDLTNAELEVLRSFADAGGNVLFFGNRDYEAPTNFAAFLADYGVTLVPTCWTDDCMINPTGLQGTFQIDNGQCIAFATVEGVEIVMRSRARMPARPEWALGILTKGGGLVAVIADETFSIIDLADNLDEFVRPLIDYIIGYE